MNAAAASVSVPVTEIVFNAPNGGYLIVRLSRADARALARFGPLGSVAVTARNVPDCGWCRAL